MNKKESFGSLVILVSLITLSCVLAGTSIFLIINYMSVAISEMPLGVLIGLIASVCGCVKLLNVGLSILKEIRST